MNNLESYLRQRWSIKKWMYHNLIEAKQSVGESFDTNVKELSDKGMIKPTPGINGWLIEMINLEEKWNINNQNNQP